MKSPEDVSELIHDVLPRLPAEALELFEHLSAIGENADLAQDLAACLREVRGSAQAAPGLSADFADAVLAALPEGLPGEALDSPLVPARGSSASGCAEVLSFSAPARPLLWSQLVAAGLLLGCGVLLGVGLRAQPPRVARTAPAPSQQPRHPRPAQPKLGESGLVEQPGEAIATDAGPARSEGRHPSVRPAAQPATLPTPRELQAYVVEASYVLEAIDTSDDPLLARALAIHLRRTALVEQGERLLTALRYDPQQRRLRPLIQGTQLVLRKVQHAPRSEAAPLQTIRHEVRRTKLLDACRELIVASLELQEPAPPQPDPQGEGLGPF